MFPPLSLSLSLQILLLYCMYTDHRDVVCSYTYVLYALLSLIFHGKLQVPWGGAVE